MSAAGPSPEYHAVNYTTDHVNCLVDGDTVFTGQTHEVDTGNVLEDCVQALFQKAGFTDVNFSDSSFYHDSSGDIHCGTNVQRERPMYKWWEIAE